MGDGDEIAIPPKFGARHCPGTDFLLHLVAQRTALARLRACRTTTRRSIMHSTSSLS